MSSIAAYIDSLHTAMRMRDDLLDDKYKPAKLGRQRRHYTEGHCFAVSEALFYLLGGKASGYKGMCIRHEGGTHWFVRHVPTGKNIDLTAKQFLTPVPYDQARGKGFMNPVKNKPSRRAQAFMDITLANKTKSTSLLQTNVAGWASSKLSK